MRLDAATRARLQAIAEEVLALKRDEDRRYSGEADVLTQEALLLELSARSGACNLVELAYCGEVAPLEG